MEVRTKHQFQLHPSKSVAREGKLGLYQKGKGSPLCRILRHSEKAPGGLRQARTTAFSPRGVWPTEPWSTWALHKHPNSWHLGLHTLSVMVVTALLICTLPRSIGFWPLPGSNSHTHMLYSLTSCYTHPIFIPFPTQSYSPGFILKCSKHTESWEDYLENTHKTPSQIFCHCRLLPWILCHTTVHLSLCVWCIFELLADTSTPQHSKCLFLSGQFCTPCASITHTHIHMHTPQSEYPGINADLVNPDCCPVRHEAQPSDTCQGLQPMETERWWVLS